MNGAAFLHHLVGSLGLVNVRVFGKRAETLHNDPEIEGKIETVVVRAVAHPEEALRIAAPFIGSKGRLVLYQSPDQVKSFKVDPVWKKEEINYTLPFSKAKRSILILSK